MNDSIFSENEMNSLKKNQLKSFLFCFFNYFHPFILPCVSPTYHTGCPISWAVDMVLHHDIHLPTLKVRECSCWAMILIEKLNLRGPLFDLSLCDLIDLKLKFILNGIRIIFIRLFNPYLKPDFKLSRQNWLSLVRF